MPDRAHPPEPTTPPGAQVYHCDLCGAEMLNKHCKIRCLACGFVRDCSDP